MTFKPTTLLGCALFALSLQSHAQTQYMVDYATLEIFNNGTSSQTLDTVDVFYSNGRVGVASPPTTNGYDILNTQTFLYDSTKGRSGVSNIFIFDLEQERAYDNNNNITMQRWGSLNNFARRQLLSYDANNRLIGTIVQDYATSTSHTWENRNRDSFTYNNAGQILAYYQFLWNTGTNQWITYGPTTAYTYANNLVDEVKHYSWNPNTQAMYLSKREKYYHTTGVLDSIQIFSFSTTPPNSLVSVNRYSYPGNDVIEEQYGYANGTYSKGPKNISKYNNSGQLIETESIDVNPQTNTWYSGGYKKTYSYNAVSGNIDTMTIQGFSKFYNTPLNSSKTLYVHNSNNLYEHIAHLYWNKTSNSWVHRQDDTVLRYHYKLNTTSVNNAINHNATCRIYPIPASDLITVSIDWQKEQDFSLAIYNMQGQLVRQTSAKATKHYNQQIPIADLAGGNYILEIRSRDGNMTRQFTKQ